MTASSPKNYGASRIVNLEFNDAVRRAKEVLEQNGWGVMSEINVQGAMKSKLGVDFRPYTILGACNPELAHRALTLDKSIGLLMPCNVVIQEQDGRVEVSIVNAETLTAISGIKEVMLVGEEANRQLRLALESI